ncbi:MAG: Glucosamine-6-phosphate deaminase [Firmicutes bacterium]|nr:Glucosamine-6-phosphate deaminase [Bacillota bacterium]
MRLVIAKDYEDMSARVARIVAGQIFLKPNSVLGLATGSTPLMMYQKLIKIHQQEGLDFTEVVTFNLDEYIGVQPSNVQSYHYYMYHNFFNHVNIQKKNIFIPNGMTDNVEIECQNYDKRILEYGGADLQILGIGNNGHIGFNEPDVKFEVSTHKVKLDDETLHANSRFFDCLEEVPRFAISMGIKNIMHAKKVILLANGENKADVIYRAFFQGITPEVPASILQMHEDVTLIIDEKAAQMIKELPTGQQ